MAIIQYFAYGSNMLTERLQERCPSAKPKGVASADNWTLTFSKKSRHGCGMGTIEHASKSRLFGVVFDVDERERARLDAAEGLGYGYNLNDAFTLQMRGSGETLQAITYIADPAHSDPKLKPYDWYRALVLGGARQHALPADYISRLEATPSIPDPELNRPERLHALVLLKRYGFDV
jgi:gamma-glutamylcyclotransferase